MNKKARSKIPLNPKTPFKWVFMDIIPSIALKILTSDKTFSNYLLIVDAYSKTQKLYGMEISLLQKLWKNWICSSPDLGKLTNFRWWDLERISADASKQFTSTELKEECQTRGVRLTLAAPEHQEMNGQVEVTWRTLRTVAHALMVHARVP